VPHDGTSRRLLHLRRACGTRTFEHRLAFPATYRRAYYLLCLLLPPAAWAHCCTRAASRRHASLPLPTICHLYYTFSFPACRHPRARAATNISYRGRSPRAVIRLHLLLICRRGCLLPSYLDIALPCNRRRTPTRRSICATSTPRTALYHHCTRARRRTYRCHPYALTSPPAHARAHARTYRRTPVPPYRSRLPPAS